MERWAPMRVQAIEDAAAAKRAAAPNSRPSERATASAVEDISGSRRIDSLDTIGRNELLAALIGHQCPRTAHRNGDTPYTAPAKPCGGRNGIADILDFQPRQQLCLAAVRRNQVQTGPTLRPQSAPQGRIQNDPHSVTHGKFGSAGYRLHRNFELHEQVIGSGDFAFDSIDIRRRKQGVGPSEPRRYYSPRHHLRR